jgi:hypothetical protein
MCFFRKYSGPDGWLMTSAVTAAVDGLHEAAFHAVQFEQNLSAT